jgi:NADH-quinone oxidoreductase subunit F
MKITDIRGLNELREAGLAKLLPGRPRVTVGMGTCGVGNDAEAVFRAFASQADAKGVDLMLTPVGCFGFCAAEPLVGVSLLGAPLMILDRLTPDRVKAVVEDMAHGKSSVGEALCKIEEWDHVTGTVTYGRDFSDVPHWHELDFYKGQRRIVLRNCGLINPEDMEEYAAVGGYQALFKVLGEMSPEEVIDEVRRARLRGRGGAGYLAATKWDHMRRSGAETKYIICNADEGDPGAYMNRNEIESDPHSLLEGMIIGAFAMGAEEGIVYVRAEYPLAVHRLQHAVEEARARGLLGRNILGTSFNFDVSLVEGAGAFVCGEETALIASLEGKAGRPRPRPPYPAEKGLFGYPTNINNVETWYNIPVIVEKGGEWFSQVGTPESTGTKVFSLVGKVKNTGLVELPLGTPLKTLVYNIGGGTGTTRKVKAVQTGGPSGGCIASDGFNATVDYESLAALGAIMGSGGVVVMDEDNCMVDVARYFIEFTHGESCGKCIPCRAGLDQMLRLLTEVTHGRATMEDLERLKELSAMIRDTSLCGLGQSAPNPVLTTLAYFMDEYEEHVRGRRCRAGACTELFLAPCENNCPLHMQIPRFLQLYKEDRLEEAFESVLLDNPLPATTGRVCQHPCQDLCRRAAIDAPVAMREVHRYIADAIFASNRLEPLTERLLARRLPATGKRVGVVGSGPAGLTAAFYLALLGHEVVVYESRPEPGGMLRYALPEYRLPKAVLNQEIELIRRLGVTFVCDMPIGDGLTLDELDRTHDAVFLAIGTWKASRLDIPGVEMKGVLHALAFLERVNRGALTSPGQQVVVVGGGNSAVDAARTARRLGADVTIAYRRQRAEMPAIMEEVEEAEEEGVKLVFLASPHKVLADATGRLIGLEVEQTELGDFDASGRRTPVPTGQYHRLPCDTLLLAIGEKVDAAMVREHGLETNRDGTVVIDRFTSRTSKSRMFAGGDLVTGASNVSNAMAWAKQAAEQIDEQLMGAARLSQVMPTYEYDHTVPVEAEGGPRNASRVLGVPERLCSFDEVCLGLDEAAVRAEAERCLRCDVKDESKSKSKSKSKGGELVHAE